MNTIEAGAGAEAQFLPEDIADIDAGFAKVNAEQLLANLEQVVGEVGSLAVGQEHKDAPLTSAILTETMLSTNHRSCNNTSKNC